MAKYGYVGQVIGNATDSKEVEQLGHGGQTVVAATGSKWKPLQTISEETNGGVGSGVKPAASSTGADIRQTGTHHATLGANVAVNNEKMVWNAIKGVWEKVKGGLNGKGKGDGELGVAPVADVVGPQMGFQQTGPADPRRALIDQAAQAQFRMGQQNLIGQLAMQASGRGPSVAGAQLQQASQANQAATFAQLASARGGTNGAGLARNAMNTSANIQAQSSRDAAVARMQEQMNAQQTLGGVLDQARGADINMATSQAGFDSQRNIAAYTQQMAMSQQYNDLKLKYAAMGLDAQKANQMAALDIQRMNQYGTLQENAADAAARAAKQQQLSQGLGAVAGVVGTVYGGPAGGAAASTGTQAAVNNYYTHNDANGKPVYSDKPSSGSGTYA